MDTEQLPGFRAVDFRARDLAAEEVERVTSDLSACLEQEERLALDHASGALRNGEFPSHRSESKPAPLTSRPERHDRDVAEALTALDFGVHVSMRYHARRRAWYDRLHRLMILVIAVGGSAGVAAIYCGLLQEAEYLALAVAVAGALELAFSLPERARVEDALYRRFNILAADIAQASAVSEEQLHAWEARRLLIKADADDRLEMLRRICHNLEAEARDYPAEYRYAVRSWQRPCAQLLSVPPLRPLRARR